MHDPRPRDPRGGRDADGGGGAVGRGYRAIPGRVVRILRLIRGGHFAPNPYVRNGWDQRIALSDHELAIAGHPTPGGDRHGGGAVPAAVANPLPHPVSHLSGGPGRHAPDDLLRAGADANPGGAANADADAGLRPVSLRLVPKGACARRAPIQGYVDAVTPEWKERWDDR